MTTYGKKKTAKKNGPVLAILECDHGSSELVVMKDKYNSMVILERSEGMTMNAYHVNELIMLAKSRRNELERDRAERDLGFEVEKVNRRIDNIKSALEWFNDHVPRLGWAKKK